MPNLTTLSLSSGSVTNTGTISTLDNSFGTAGTSNANVLTVQGVSSGNPITTAVTGTATITGTVSVSGTVPVTVSGITVSSSSLNVNIGTGGSVTVSGVTVSSSSLNVNVGTPAVTIGNVTVSGSSLNVNVTNATLTSAVSGVTVSSSSLNVNIGTGGSVTVSGVTVSSSSLNVNVGTPTVTLSGAVFTASSTAPTSAQAALVVAISPNSVNPNGRAKPTSSAPVVFASQTYQAVGASSTNVALSGGSGGSTGDYLDGVLVVPSSVSPGSVLLIDNTTSSTIFTGGTTSLSNLVPFFVPIGALSANGAWKLTTGSNVTCIATGNFY